MRSFISSIRRLIIGPRLTLLSQANVDELINLVILPNELNTRTQSDFALQHNKDAVKADLICYEEKVRQLSSTVLQLQERLEVLERIFDQKQLISNRQETE